MAEGVKIGSGVVDITADMSKFDNAMNALPRRASYKMDAAMKSLQAQMARTKLDLKLAVNQAAINGNTAPIVALTIRQEQLKEKIDAVTNAAKRQAQALQDAARADIRNSTVPARIGKDSPAVLLDKAGKAGANAGRQIREGGMSGAMGLMMLSQTIDDVQYGFRAIVNNIPQLGMAVGSLMGLSTEASLKLGAIAGIAAVAINTVITHWDQLFDRFGYGTETMRTIWKQFWGEAKDITVDALDVIEKRLKELHDKPIKTAVDLHETETLKAQAKELQEGRAAFEQMGRGRSPFEKESGQKITELFANTDAATMKRLQEQLINKRAEAKNATSPAINRVTLTPEEEATIRKNLKSDASSRRGYAGLNTVELPADKAAQDAAVEAEKARRIAAAQLARKANEREAKDELSVIIGKAQKGDAQGVEDLIKALSGAGYHGMAGAVRGLTPEAAADNAAFKTEQEALARQAAIRDMLNEQGKEGERDYLEQKAASRSAEATRFAQQLQPRLSGSVAAMGGGTQEELEAKVKAALQKAGVAADDIGKMTTEVATKIRQGVEERIRTKVLGGLTQEQAVRSVRQEDRDAQQALKRLPKSEILSTDSYLNKLLVAGMSREGAEPKPVKLDDGQIGGVNDRLDKLLDATKENKPGVARFAGGAGGDAARENGPMM